MKKVLYVLIALFLVYLILALFGPKQIKVERSISINKLSPLVRAKLGDFKYFHDEWSPWSERDPKMKNTYKGNPGEVGHFYSWVGNKEVGSGEMELKAFNGDSIIQRLTFDDEGDSKVYYLTAAKEKSTDLTWGLIMEIGFFGRPIMLFLNIDKMLGADFEKGLSKLKTKLESIKEEIPLRGYEIKQVSWEAKTFIGTKRVQLEENKLGSFFADNFPKMWSDLEKEKIKSPMYPCGMFFSFDEKTRAADCAAIMEVPQGKVFKVWEKYSLPATKVLSVPYYGAPENSIEAHYAMVDYIKENILQYSFVIEEYVTDPAFEKDTARWLTNIYYILK